MITIRPERPADIGHIHTLVAAAFGQPDEADLIHRLRLAGAATISLVAQTEEGDQIVGHILFSPVTIHPSHGRSRITALGLAPLAVAPQHQNQGIGAQLVRAGLDACRQSNHQLGFVLGHSGYYPRFGFQPAHRHNLRWNHPVPPEAFMVAELTPGALARLELDGRAATVHYHPTFDQL